MGKFTTNRGRRVCQRQGIDLNHLWSLVGMTAAAAAAKSLQSCPTLSDPMDCSLPGSSVCGIFQARVLEWGAIAFSVLNSRWILYR